MHWHVNRDSHEGKDKVEMSRVVCSDNMDLCIMHCGKIAWWKTRLKFNKTIMDKDYQGF